MTTTNPAATDSAKLVSDIQDAAKYCDQAASSYTQSWHIQDHQLWKARAERLREAANLIERQASAPDDGNYVADREVEPRKVRFTNGRIVRVVGDGYLEVERDHE